MSMTKEEIELIKNLNEHNKHSLSIIKDLLKKVNILESTLFKFAKSIGTEGFAMREALTYAYDESNKEVDKDVPDNFIDKLKNL